MQTMHKKHNKKWIINQLLDAFETDILLKTLKPLERLVLISIAKFANLEGECYPSLNKLSSITGIHSKHINRYLNSLVDKNIITKTNNRNQRWGQKNNSYKIKYEQIIPIEEPKVIHRRPKKEEIDTTIVGVPYHHSGGHIYNEAFNNPLITIKEKNKKEKKTKDESTRNDQQEEKKEIYTIEIPNWISEEIWYDYLEYRQQMKSPLNIQAQNKVITKLEKYKREGHDVEDIINTSIMNGWKGLFAPTRLKERNNGQRTHSEITEILWQNCVNARKQQN